MKISMDILYRECQELNPVMYDKKNTTDMKYIGVCHISNLISYTEGYLLFGKAEQFDMTMEGAGIICIGKIKNPLINRNDIISFPKETDEDVLYKKLLSIFIIYEEWNSKLHQSIMTENNLQTIVEISEPILKNPIFIHDMNFNMLASIDANYGRQIWNNDTNNGMVINMDILNDFKVDKEYQSTLSVYGPAFFSDVMFGYRVLYINLWIENQYFGRICICEINRKIEECDKLLLNYISEYVIHTFRLGYSALSEKPRYLKNALYKIINGEIIESKQLEIILANSDWGIEDSFFCACLFTDTRDIKTNTIKTTCMSLELHFQKTCIFTFYDNIIIIVNTSLNDSNINTFTSELSVFLREGLFKVGISSIGKGFINLKNYYLQAAAAYEIGSQKDESFWKFNFDDYVLPYIFNRATMVLPKDMISSKDLLILKKYDKEHQTDLFLTLKIYLENNLNLTSTSDFLEIHRTTLLYRLDRIKNLININIYDPKQRFFLLWSYYLQE